MGKYRKRQEIVEARELEELEVIPTLDMTGNAGDFVVMGEGEQYRQRHIVEREVFLEMYEEVEAQIGRVRFVDPLPCPQEEIVVRDEIVQKAAALDCLMVLIEGQDQPSLRAKAQAAAEKIDGADAVSAIVSGLCMISWTMENGGTGSLDGGMTWFRFEEPDKPAIPCDCETCEEEKAKQAGPCAPQGDSGSGSI